MAHILIQRAAVLHPRHARMRRRQDRRLTPVRPSRRNELWYRAQLGMIVEHLRAAGAEVLRGMRPRWPVVQDARAPGLEQLIQMAAARFANIRGVAERLADLAARRNLTEVDRRLVESIKRSVGVDLSAALTDLSPADDGKKTIREVMAEKTDENVDLIKSIPEQYFEQLADSVSGAWERGDRWETLADEIALRGDVAESRARLIARDQTSKMNAAFNEVRQTGLGIEKYTWSTAGDERVRPEHRDLNNTVQSWDDPPVVDGEEAHPGEPVNCRCIAIPLLDVDNEPGGGEFGGLEPDEEELVAA